MKKIVDSLIKKFAKPLWLISFLLIGLVIVYFSVIATDRFVSKAHVVLQSPEIAPPELSFSSMLGGGSAGNRADLLLLRDHLQSMDMLKKLDAEFDLRSHFAQSGIDYFSRLKDTQLPLEKFYDYYLSRISVELDDYSGVLIVEAQMFSPQMAQQVVQRLLEYGEQHMNKMGQRLAQEQVNFIEKQVAQLSERLIEANRAVLDFQNKEGLLSPSQTAVSMSGVITELQAQIISLKAKRTSLSSFQSARSAEMKLLNSQVDSLEKQIQQEQKKLTSQSGQALNQVTLEFESLKLKAQFAQELYANSLATLEATRVEAARKLKQVSVLAEPNLPEYSTEPQRLYLSSLFSLLIVFITLILKMVFMIIKDHKD
ncbi:capsule polysaccharide export inner-membrane protein KpsE [Thiosulfatimonas sediminis]|uniref:Capsule polysaccharide export inner-membrane protein KpsE n=1 Tax=Thiosulfatimonas sediminis TaxID=2675054 RepID=A0A6F8PVJ7_9GAMM|nr:chain-length determining protein [Thiosulfatimonas sediminis]BBP46172.1 capsule polysaccharide export inner-membrane protein KpsE [Thiosulfatimonas sediminis]